MSLSIFVFEEIAVTEEFVIEILLISVADNLPFTPKELADLCDALRISIGSNADKLTNSQLSQFGTSMLLATSVVLKAKYHLRSNKELTKHYEKTN